MKKALLFLFVLISAACNGQTIYREWTLVKIIDSQANFELVTYPEHKATVTFEDTKYGGSTGINGYAGKVNYSNDSLFFYEVLVTQKGAVNEEKTLVEKYMLECISQKASYIIVQDTLKLTTQRGLVLRFF